MGREWEGGVVLCVYATRVLDTPIYRQVWSMSQYKCRYDMTA